MQSIILFTGFVCLAGVIETARFDSSSITANRSGSSALSTHVQYSPPPITLTMRNVTLKFCLQQAYSLTEHQVSGPAWINSARYDVTATLSPGDPAEQVWPSLRTLLQQRFELSLEQETKVMPVYILAVSSTGAKLRPAKERDSGTPQQHARQMKSDSVHLDYATIEQFCSTLSRRLDRMVVDETGLAGSFAFDLVFDGGRDRSGLGIFSAIQKQIGLKLTPGNRPVQTLRIRRAKR